MNVKWMRMAVPLVLMACFVMTAGAGLTNLPKSSFRSGTSYKLTATQACRVEFAVYDTTIYPDDLTGSQLSNLGTGRYVYAYQIFSNAASIPFFVIQGLGVNAVTNNGIGTYNDLGTNDVDLGLNSVNATSSGLNASQTSVVFEFNGGILSSGKNSWYLVLRSDHGPTVGSYSFEPTDSDALRPNPEPASLLLMGLGAAGLFKRKKK